MSTLNNFSKSKQIVLNALSHIVDDDEHSCDRVVSQLRAAVSADDAVRNVFEHCIRVRLNEILSSQTEETQQESSVRSVLRIAMRCVHDQFVSGETFVLLVQDVMEAVDINRAARLFALVEEHAAALANSLAEQQRALLVLLRMCIELMRRMSKSEHTVFCGRVLLFLAQVYPLSDRSGLNAKGDINVANVTLFEDEAVFTTTNSITANASDATATTVEATSSSTGPIDYQFYKTFWSLQAQLRDPGAVLANADAWHSFELALDSVLAALSTQRVTVAGGESAHDDDADSFVKYLTSSSLLDLQLSDASFRRHVLLQMLIAFHTLLDKQSDAVPTSGAAATTAAATTPTDTATLSSTQRTHVLAFKKRALALLRETPPRGEAFEAAVSRVLRREGGWTAWKTSGCPSFAREREQLKRKLPPSGAAAKRSNAAATPAGTTIAQAVAQGNNLAMRAGRLPPTFEELVQPLRDDLIEFEDDVDFATDHVFSWRLMRGAAMTKLSLLSRMVGVTKASEVFKLVDEDQQAREAKAKQPAVDETAAGQPAVDEAAAVKKAGDDEELGQDLPDDATTASTQQQPPSTSTPLPDEPEEGALEAEADVTDDNNNNDDDALINSPPNEEPDVDVSSVAAPVDEDEIAEPEEAVLEPAEAVVDAEPEPEPSVERDIEEEAARDTAEMPTDSAAAEAAIDDEIGAL